MKLLQTVEATDRESQHFICGRYKNTLQTLHNIILKLRAEECKMTMMSKNSEISATETYRNVFTVKQIAVDEINPELARFLV